MKQAVYEQPCWGLGGRSYVEVKGYDTGDDFDETFYDEDDDDFFDWEDDEGLLEEDSDIDSNSLHDLLLGLADSDQPQDKIVNKVNYPKRNSEIDCLTVGAVKEGWQEIPWSA